MNTEKITSKRRVPGRPAGLDNEQTRASILDAAVGIWARTGISASSLREIAKAAQVSPALLNYHFTDKDGLIDAFIAQRLMPELQALHLKLGAVEGASVLELARIFIQAKLDLATRQPYFAPLWLREVLCEGGVLRDKVVQRLGPLIPRHLADRFTQAKANSRLAEGVDPSLLVVSLIGLSLFAVAAKPVWQNFFPTQAAGASETMLEHAMALLTHGIENPHA